MTETRQTTLANAPGSPHWLYSQFCILVLVERRAGLCHILLWLAQNQVLGSLHKLSGYGISYYPPTPFIGRRVNTPVLSLSLLLADPELSRTLEVEEQISFIFAREQGIYFLLWWWLLCIYRKNSAWQLEMYAFIYLHLSQWCKIVPHLCVLNSEKNNILPQGPHNTEGLLQNVSFISLYPVQENTLHPISLVGSLWSRPRQKDILMAGSDFTMPGFCAILLRCTYEGHLPLRCIYWSGC